MKRFVLTIVLLISVVACATDTMIMKNGKTVDGDITHYADGKISIRTETGDVFTGEIEKVKEIHFDSGEVKLSDATQVKQSGKIYRSAKDIIDDMPAKLLPSADNANNPILRRMAQEWLDENIKGATVVFTSREVLGISRGGVDIAAGQFTKDSHTYSVRSNDRNSISCHYKADQKRMESVLAQLRLPKYERNDYGIKGEKVANGSNVDVCGKVALIEIRTRTGNDQSLLIISIEASAIKEH